MDATIFAVASGAGRAAIAVIRMSGPEAGSTLSRLCGPLPAPRRAVLRRLRDPAGSDLDRAMVLWLPGPGSYTGEHSAELHVHGGVAVIHGVAEALVSLGARPAEPGEFTRRAFLNGRMDLLEAEAVADLVAAETAGQRSQALRQLDGALGTLYHGWSERLRRLVAHQEALIDFPDEDLPPEIEAALLADVAALQSEIAAHLDDGRRGERLRNGLVFVIVGPPNVGKSSLINALAERSVAIVSSVPGTTRDALEARVDIGGIAVTLVDTAGLRETRDEIEAEGVRRARHHAAEADLVIAVGEAAQPPVAPPDAAAVLLVSNKDDLDPTPSDKDGEIVAVSALTGAGLDALRDRLAAEARALTATAGPPPLTRARHRAALRDTLACLASVPGAALPELRGEDLRLALRALGRVTGRVGVEDILDSVFGQFCIGK